MSDSAIRYVVAREILDSRGNPTVEVEVELEGGAIGRAAVPSGASTGTHEALELRDGDKRFGGKGVQKAVENVHLLGRSIEDLDAFDQHHIDTVMLDADGTPNKSKYGANAILGVSMAVARAGAESMSIPLWRYLGGSIACTLPVPMMNILNGGAHADNGLDVQEFMVCPVGFDRYSDGAARGRGDLPQAQGHAEEGGPRDLGRRRGRLRPAPQEQRGGPGARGLGGDRRGVQAGHGDRARARRRRERALRREDPALPLERRGPGRSFTGRTVSSDGRRYPLISIEDGAAEDDWESWKLLTATLGPTTQLVGDDLFVTNPERLKRGISEGIANSILIKLNQIGTVTETLDTMRMAARAGYTSVVSHRSGETEDTFIADLAVATNSGLIKTGSLSRGERTAKYNQLLRIESQLADGALYLGRAAFRAR